MDLSSQPNMYYLSSDEYVGDAYFPIVYNFACLDARVCNLLTQGQNYEIAFTAITSLQDLLAAAYTATSAGSGEWDDMSTRVHYSSAFWLPPITLVYDGTFNPGQKVTTTVAQWLNDNYDPDDYQLEQTFFIYVPQLSLDPVVRTETYGWTVGLQLEPTYVANMALYVFIIEQQELGRKWVQKDFRTLPQGYHQFDNRHSDWQLEKTFYQHCGCFGTFPGWGENCHPPGDLPDPYYMLTDPSTSIVHCFIDAKKGQYDRYLGQYVRLSNDPTVQYLLTKTYPRSPLSASQLCSATITDFVGEDCGAPTTCYKLTLQVSAGDCQPTDIITSSPVFANYIGKVVPIIQDNVPFASNLYYVTVASSCKCAVSADIDPDGFCFKLTECSCDADPLYVSNDMYQYLGKAVVINGNPYKWNVEDNNFVGGCEGTTKLSVSVVNVFDSCNSDCPACAIQYIDPPFDPNINTPPPSAPPSTGTPPSVPPGSEPPRIPPTPPTNLTATGISDSEVLLTWLDNAVNEDGYIAQWSTDGTTWTTFATLVANSVSAIMEGLAPETFRLYRVAAYNAGGTQYSSQASATTLPAGGGGGGGSSSEPPISEP